MCGIAGLLHGRGVPPRIEVAARMGAMLRHRGPDAGGEWAVASEEAALAHRRLAILDLTAAGAQPMISHCGRYVLTYNGEIFNFTELRAAVERARGAVAWRGHSDTEYLLELIATSGLAAALATARGMFAFAVWDRQTRRLTLVRDRLGKKPLYYGFVGNELAFASEVAAFSAHPAWKFAVDSAAIAEYLRCGYVPEPRSGFAGLQKLPAGTQLIVAPEDVSARCLRVPEPYWSARELCDAPPSSVESLRDVVDRAVAARMVADVPVGAFLSGGVDSTVVTALMSRRASHPVRTFTVGFSDSVSSEAAHARDVARHLGTVHEEIVLTPREAADLVPTVVQSYDEPFADSSSVPTWLVSRLAASRVKVVLSGDGADEIFGGYTRYHADGRTWSQIARVPAGLRRALLSTLVPWTERPAAGRWAAMLGAARAPDVRAFYRRRTSYFLDPRRIFRHGGAASSAPDEHLSSPLRTMMHMDLRTYLRDDILAKVDRASMAHGLEVRSPFLDEGVVEYAWGLPDSDLIGESGGKACVKALLHSLVPRELVDRPKTGFGLPIEDWLSGRLRGWAEDLLIGSSTLTDLGCDAGAVRSVWRGLLSGERRLAGPVWVLLMLAEWHGRHSGIQIAS